AAPPPRGVETWCELRALGTSTRLRARASLRARRVRIAELSKHTALSHTASPSTPTLSRHRRLTRGAAPPPQCTVFRVTLRGVLASETAAQCRSNMLIAGGSVRSRNRFRPLQRGQRQCARYHVTVRAKASSKGIGGDQSSASQVAAMLTCSDPHRRVLSAL